MFSVTFNKTLVPVAFACICFGYLIQTLHIHFAAIVLFFLSIVTFPITTVTAIVTAIIGFPSWFQEAQVIMFNGTYCQDVKQCCLELWASSGSLPLLLPGPTPSPTPATLQTSM